MAESYCTILRTGRGEYTEKKSRFLGEAVPIAGQLSAKEAFETQKRVREELDRIRKQYYDARHHCYAYVLGAGGEQKHSSDDGEPSGTAGAPILKVIEGAGCTGVLIVVTRYFGGTLLGTGGLVRAYTEAAQRALQDAGIVVMQKGQVLRLTFGYSMLDRVNYLLRQEHLNPEEPNYTERVQICVKVPEQQVPVLMNQLQAIGNGSILAETTERGYYGFT